MLRTFLLIKNQMELSYKNHMNFVPIRILNGLYLVYFFINALKVRNI